jgi:hypothetical protein
MLPVNLRQPAGKENTNMSKFWSTHSSACVTCALLGWVAIQTRIQERPW